MTEIRVTLGGKQDKLFMGLQEIPYKILNLHMKERLVRKSVDEIGRPIYGVVGEPVAKVCYVDTEGSEHSMYAHISDRKVDTEMGQVLYILTPLEDFQDTEWEVMDKIY